MDIKWKISPYQHGDESQIKKLQKEIYGDELEPEKNSIDFWKWEFLCNPFGKAFINTAKVNKKVVGHYAVIPIEYILLNKIVKAGLAVDAMTHSKYRKQGMFVSLGRSSMEWIKNNNYAFSTGYFYLFSQEVRTFLNIQTTNWKNLNREQRGKLIFQKGKIAEKLTSKTE